MFTVLLPPGVSPIAVKYIISILAFLIGNSGRSSVSNTIISAADVQFNHTIFLYTPRLVSTWKYAVIMLRPLYPRGTTEYELGGPGLVQPW